MKSKGCKAGICFNNLLTDGLSAEMLHKISAVGTSFLVACANSIPSIVIIHTYEVFGMISTSKFNFSVIISSTCLDTITLVVELNEKHDIFDILITSRLRPKMKRLTNKHRYLFFADPLTITDTQKDKRFRNISLRKIWRGGNLPGIERLQRIASVHNMT